MSKTSCMIALAAGVVSCTVSLAAAPVDVSFGTLRLGGVLQTIYGHSQTAKWSFAAKRARLIFNGELPEQRIKYLIQLEALSNPALLDARVQAAGYLPKTDVCLGRFLPAFSFYMTRSTTALEMINYPLLVTRYAMWRQVGVQTTTKVAPFEMNLGVFNGYPANNISDNNPGKDLLFSASAKPMDYLQFIGYCWLGNAVSAREQDTLTNRFGGGVFLERKLCQAMQLTARMEAAAGQNRIGRNGPMVKSGSYYVHLGLRPHPKLELLGRWERFDTERAGDGVGWLTGGVNYYLSGNNVALFANYIHKKSELPGTPKDDEFVMQVQLAF